MKQDNHDIQPEMENPDDQDVTMPFSRSDHELKSKDFEFQVDELEEVVTDNGRRFKFICYFAVGGMGRLSRARDLTFNRVVAVKTLKDKYRNDPQAVKSFLEECRLNAQLDHPAIVPVYALDKDQSGHWEVIMKYIDGSSLAAFLKLTQKAYEGKEITLRQEKHALLSRLEYFIKICEVINYCHSRKIAHGDLKPDNIMLGQFGEVYIMDWGSAGKIGTVPENLTGTPRYMAPEYVKKHMVTELVDVFALGKILYEIVTLDRGKRSCLLDSEVRKFTTKVELPEEWVYYSGVRMDPEMKAIIRKAIEPDPERRYQCVKDIRDDVRHFIYDEEASVAPFSLTRKLFRLVNRNKVKSILAACFILLLATTALMFGFFQAQAKAMEQERSRSTMQRLRFQTYTDELAAAVERNFLTAQAQLLMLADNLQEFYGSEHKAPAKVYTNEDFRLPETSPPGMLENTNYTFPVHPDHMVLLPGRSDHAFKTGAFDPGQFIRVCRKVLRADLDNYDLRESGNIQAILFSDKNPVHRVFVRWANDACYSYPGTYDNTDSLAYGERRRGSESLGNIHSIVWSHPYEAVNGTHRIICSHALYGADGQYIGTAGLELRLERVLSPVKQAHRDDPVHRFYFVDIAGRRAAIVDGYRIILPDTEGFYPDRVHVSEIFKAVDHLQTTKFQQYIAPINGRPQFICGALFKNSRTILLQMIDAEEMKAHYHHDD